MRGETLCYRNVPLNIVGGLTIGIVVLITYFAAWRIGFWSDDYAFIEVAARLSFIENLLWYFDPRLQSLWYRPIPGMLWWFEWRLFGADPLGYHLVYVLIHFVNCLLLYVITTFLLKDWLIGFVAAVVYAGISVYSYAVLRPSDETALSVLFYLLAILFWVKFLFEHRLRSLGFAYVFFLLALLSKESSVTLPVMLFLVDRLLVQRHVSLGLLIRRYLPFVVVLIPYLAFEFTLAPNTQYRINLGYELGLHIFTTLGQYLAYLALPWRIPEAEYIWLALVGLGIAYALIRFKNRYLFFGILGVFITLAPYLPFQFVFTRFLYLPMMFPAVILGTILVQVGRKTWQTQTRVFIPGTLSLLVFLNGLQTATEIVDLERFARECRLPLRTISQRHPAFPPNTFLYFIDPPVPLYSGMFYLRYGPQVKVGGDIGVYDSLWKNIPPKSADLCNYEAAFVFYFDEYGKMRESRAVCHGNVMVEPLPPLDFESSIHLEGYEVVNREVRPSQDLIVLLYWRAKDHIPLDYTVFAHLLDRDGNMVAGADSQPRGGKKRTSSWRVGEPIVDWIILPVPEDLAHAEYILAFGLYDLKTMQRLGITDTNGQVFSDRVIIYPISVLK